MPRGSIPNNGIRNNAGQFTKGGAKANASPGSKANGTGSKANGAGSKANGTATGSEAPPVDGDEIRDELFSDPAEAFGAGANNGSDSAARNGNHWKGKTGPYKSHKKKAVQASLEGIEAMLMSIHLMGSTLFQLPELVITQGEADQLGRAIGRVAALYDFGVSERVMAWANLGVVLCGVYGTRAYAYHLRMKAESEKKKAPAPGPVISWPVMAQSAAPQQQPQAETAGFSPQPAV